MSSSLLSMLVVTVFATQTPTPAAPKKAAGIAVTGCLSQDPSTPGSYTFADTNTGARYRVSGMKDTDRHGALVLGTGTRRVIIRGGLEPSPNVAAQAGALDPARVASMPGGTQNKAGSTPLPEFRVERMRAIGGSCP